jgi:hypothetical protein
MVPPAEATLDVLTNVEGLRLVHSDQILPLLTAMAGRVTALVFVGTVGAKRESLPGLLLAGASRATAGAAAVAARGERSRCAGVLQA